VTNTGEIEAVAFDCFGTLIDFGDEAFADAYGLICAEQGIPVDGKTFYDKWMEIWRRLTIGPQAAEALSSHNGVAANTPAVLSRVEEIPDHPEHHAPSAGRNRALDGPVGPFRTYRQEWTEHFALCFEELGVHGHADVAHERLRELLVQSRAFPEARRVVDRIGRRMPTAMLSNADDDFLYPTLNRNGLTFPVVVSSESAQAYKPHVAIFKRLGEEMGLPLGSILYVGDSRLADITGARHAGMKAAWVNRRHTTEWNVAGRTLLEPDYEVETLDGLAEILGL
jgi:2-haloalkanoic acid dehalogenase type II